jgi:hypothetical protein
VDESNVKCGICCYIYKKGAAAMQCSHNKFGNISHGSQVSVFSRGHRCYFLARIPQYGTCAKELIEAKGLRLPVSLSS